MTFSQINGNNNDLILKRFAKLDANNGTQNGRVDSKKNVPEYMTKDGSLFNAPRVDGAQPTSNVQRTTNTQQAQPGEKLGSHGVKPGNVTYSQINRYSSVSLATASNVDLTRQKHELEEMKRYDLPQSKLNEINANLKKVNQEIYKRNSDPLGQAAQDEQNGNQTSGASTVSENGGANKPQAQEQEFTLNSGNSAQHSAGSAATEGKNATQQANNTSAEMKNTGKEMKKLDKQQKADEKKFKKDLQKNQKLVQKDQQQVKKESEKLNALKTELASINNETESLNSILEGTGSDDEKAAARSKLEANTTVLTEKNQQIETGTKSIKTYQTKSGKTIKTLNKETKTFQTQTKANEQQIKQSQTGAAKAVDVLNKVDTVAGWVGTAGTAAEYVGKGLQKIGTHQQAEGQAEISAGQPMLSNPYTAAEGAALVSKGAAAVSTGVSLQVGGATTEAVGVTTSMVANYTKAAVGTGKGVILATQGDIKGAMMAFGSAAMSAVGGVKATKQIKGAFDNIDVVKDATAPIKEQADKALEGAKIAREKATETLTKDLGQEKAYELMGLERNAKGELVNTLEGKSAKELSDGLTNKLNNIDLTQGPKTQFVDVGMGKIEADKLAKAVVNDTKNGNVGFLAAAGNATKDASNGVIKDNLINAGNVAGSTMTTVGTFMKDKNTGAVTNPQEQKQQVKYSYGTQSGNGLDYNRYNKKRV